MAHIKEIKNSVLLAVVLQFSAGAHALQDCSKGTSDGEVEACSENNKNLAEAALNKEYSEAKKRISDVFSQDENVRRNYMEIFTEAQRSWLKFRGFQCEMEAHPAVKGTNLHLDYVNTCLANLDVERTNTLKKIPYD
ncbi:lysozyme inhibitor LprI family protein [Erwinia sp. HDF1-3R]|uniref:lysozyme inhibitor LprI family protein n=1 Tax=Erwinia sp. HDF1-3R TaxID=3141543 RepID=UPI0031F4B4D3